MRIKAIGGMLAISLLFSGVVVVAGGTMGAEDQSRLPIHRGEFCRDAMMESLGVPEEEIDQLVRKAALANGSFHAPPCGGGVPEVAVAGYTDNI